MEKRNARPETTRFRQKKEFEKFPVCGHHPHRVLLLSEDRSQVT
jgi:hypothetical protein